MHQLIIYDVYIYLIACATPKGNVGGKVTYEFMDVLPFPNPNTRRKLEKIVGGVCSPDLPIHRPRLSPIFHYQVSSTIQR